MLIFRQVKKNSIKNTPITQATIAGVKAASRVKAYKY